MKTKKNTHNMPTDSREQQQQLYMHSIIKQCFSCKNRQSANGLDRTHIHWTVYSFGLPRGKCLKASKDIFLFSAQQKKKKVEKKRGNI